MKSNKPTDFIYADAREQYAAWNVDTEKAIAQTLATPLSLHCWQGDDVTGFENASGISDGGIMATGNYPYKAQTPNQLRSDIQKALSLIGGSHRVNLHAIYAEIGSKKVDRCDLAPEHFSTWVSWAKELGVALDFNPSYFSHPHAASGFTLSHRDAAIRRYWIDHGIACRKIAESFGKKLKSPCITNFWIPDGYKDLPSDRIGPRERLIESLDAIFAEPINKRYNRDAVECKLFGIGSESYVTGSHEFYMGYSLARGIIPTLDAGHFHPTETIADKISSIMLYSHELLLHVSRGIRWDSDHIVITTDDLIATAREIVQSERLGEIHISLDYFDASINRIAAWVIGMRSMQKALLMAHLEPSALLNGAENSGDHTTRLALFEERNSRPFAAIWNEFCSRANVPTGNDWLADVHQYEATVLSKRSTVLVAKDTALNDLMFISHVLGRNEMYVQAGGGNTSVKCADGTSMLIKASGTPLGEMSETQGWVKVDLAKVTSLFNQPHIMKLSAAKREQKVLAVLGESIIEPLNARPSVETPLHALLGTVIMHSHPVIANALTCHPDGKNILASLELNPKNPALWVPYTDPGSSLAYSLFDALALHTHNYGVSPTAIFLQNHGFFCVGETSTECVELHLLWMNTLESHLRTHAHSADIQEADLAALRKSIKQAARALKKPTPRIRVSCDPTLASALGSDLINVFKGSLTPDHVVYMGPHAIFIPSGCHPRALEEACIVYTNKNNQFPRVFVLEKQAIAFAGDSEKKLDATEALAVSAVRTALASGNTYRHMPKRDIDFILNWEAEHYRAKQC